MSQVVLILTSIIYGDLNVFKMFHISVITRNEYEHNICKQMLSQ